MSVLDKCARLLAENRKIFKEMARKELEEYESFCRANPPKNALEVHAQATKLTNLRLKANIVADA